MPANRSYICNALPQCYPAEGVGQRLFAQIKEQNRGPRPKTYVADSVKVWQNWYTALFGLGESVPSYKLEETDFTRCNDPNFQDDYRKRLKLTFSRPLPLGHKARALADHMKSQQHVEMQILKELIGKEVIEQADAARHQPPSATKRKAGVTKGGQRPQASRRRTSTMSSSSEFAKATPEVYHLGPSRHDMMHNHVFDFVNDGLENRPCLDLFHQSATDTSLATTLAGFPAHALSTTSYQLGHESEIYDSFCGSQQLTFPYADWTASASRLDNTFLPEMTDTSNTLPQFNLDAFSIDAQPPIQREDTDFTGEHSKERCKVALPSAADRIAHLPIHSNSLFQNFVPVDTEF
ncbi:hypothetical protein SLS60_005896 [Paraconiothyrium brasiliense]|uniref:Uncharacterized protein n=1 Tax=Paraconiothyrium brasiliense TaxID=300254 RepID=A0ABR3RDG0_9PLEO